MYIRVAIAGYDSVGKRAADAVTAQRDMRLVLVHEPRAQRHEMIRHKGHPLSLADPIEVPASCDVLVNCEAIVPSNLRCPVIHASRARRDVTPVFSALTDAGDLRGNRQITLAGADALACARIVSCLGDVAQIRRVYASVVRRSSPATEPTGLVDALEPAFDLEHERDQFERVLGPAEVESHIQSVRAPCTNVHMQMLKIDLVRCGIDEVLSALGRDNRIFVARGPDGFENTGLVQEFFRDMGRIRGDQSEVFVWQESVDVQGASLYLTLSVHPEAVMVPELIDAIRVLVRPDISLEQSVVWTDHALGLGQMGTFSRGAPRLGPV